MPQMLQELNELCQDIRERFWSCGAIYREHIRRQWLCEPLRVLILLMVMIYNSGEVADLVKCFVVSRQIGWHVLYESL
jgi:hypothetical protein